MGRAFLLSMRSLSQLGVTFATVAPRIREMSEELMEHYPPIRLMLVDDQPVIRSGIQAFLAAYEEFKLIAEAADGEEAIRLCTQFAPDVILMDLLMPRLNGVNATRIIRTRYPEIQVLVLTNFIETELVHDALAAGAIGYLYKNITAEELAIAIRHAAQGRSTIAPETMKCLLQDIHKHPALVGENLTSREREVLQLVVTGMSNRAIAQALTVSQSTVKFHMSNILAKLHTKARTEVISVALRHHLVAQ